MGEPTLLGEELQQQRGAEADDDRPGGGARRDLTPAEAADEHRRQRRRKGTEGERPDQLDDWHASFGDRAQQLVFIGQNMNEATLRERLNACLLEADIMADRGAWTALPNPFPELEVVEFAS